MKKSHFLFFALSALMLYSCNHGTEQYVTYMTNEPVFMSVSEFRSSVDVEAPKPIEEQGKIAFYNDYLYISQPGKGIHVIDNRKPSNPHNIAFIELLGNADMHIRGNMLYADSFIDLVWFDISNPATPVFKGRKEEVFPESLPPVENNYVCDYSKAMDRKNGVVVGWKVVERKELVQDYNSGWNWRWGWAKEGLMYTDNATASSGSSTGMVGSMSRFAIYKDYLYTILQNRLDIFDLSGEEPEKVGKEVYVGDNAETIFPYKDYLFFGTPTGMIVYSVKNPIEPDYMSRVTHILGCDPVVVENDIAYVTVRSGDFCGQDIDMLMVIDVKDVKHPKPIVDYAMYNPKGLGIDNGTLFVCDKGLRVFDAKDPLTLLANELAHFKEMDGLDVIPYNDVLMMIANDGIYQYDYTDVTDIKLLSVLPIGK